MIGSTDNSTIPVLVGIGSLSPDFREAARTCLVNLSDDYGSFETVIDAPWCAVRSTLRFPHLNWRNKPVVFHQGTNGLRLLEECPASTGVKLTIDPEAQRISIEGDLSGAFPLYFAFSKDREAFLFSTHQRVLAQLVAAAPDMLGVMQYLRNSYTLAGRSFFSGVSRLQPREKLLWSAREGLLTRSKAIIPEVPDTHSSALVNFETLWDELKLSSEIVVPPQRLALMMSGGWDSRTLLGAACPGKRDNSELLCYTHGDLQSRELELVAQLAQISKTALHCEPITSEMFSAGNLGEYTLTAETALFPHWFAAGKRLRALGVSVAQSGVFGELLGGHYGRSMVLHGLSKMGSVAQELLGLSGRSANMPAASLAKLILGQQPFVPWFVSTAGVDQNAVPAEAEIAAECLSQVAASIAEYTATGLSEVNELIEWFITEHRGAQYIAAQARSLQPHVALSLPFIMPGVVKLVRRFAFAERVHNSLNRRLLMRFYPELLRLPLASTLVAATEPPTILELSRLARRMSDSMQRQLNRNFPSLVRPLRRSWVNYDFMANGHEITAICESLQQPWWNFQGIEAVIAAIKAGKYPYSLHPVTEVLLKMYTVDRLLSR